jgi:hypothetical protein
MVVMDREANLLLGMGGIPIATRALGTNLAVASGHELQQAVTALSDSASFSSVSRCSLCGRERIVICSN